MSQTKAQLLNPLGDLDLTGQLTGVGATFTGNITAVDGIFSGNVSVAGTLTKQDVTNVDSVGLITARSGINVTGGNVFIGQGGSGANNAELKLQAGAGTGNDIIAFLNQAGVTKGNITYDTDNNFLLFNVNASERLRIKSDGAVNLTTANASLEWTASSGSNPFIRSIGSGQQSLEFNTGGNEALRITSNGSVGINSTSPSASEKLTIRGGTDDSAKFTFHSYADFLGASDAWEGYSALFRGSKASNPNSQWLGIGATTAYGWIDFANNSASRINITSTGVGLGVNNPEGLLHLFGDNNTNGPELYLTVNNNNTSDNIGALIYGNNSDKTLLKIQGLTHTANNTGDLTFHTSTAGTMGERLRIGNAGQIGIAGANYGNAGQVLTSGGSGSAISWADAAGGATYAGISSGAMSAGDPVVVRDDGKLEKVKYSWNESIATGSVAEKNSINIPSAGVWASWARNDDGTTWVGDHKRVLFLFRNSNSPSYITADYDGNNMTLNSMSGFNDGDNVAIFDGAYNSNGKRFAVAYRHGGNGRIRVNSGRPSGTTVTWGTTSNNGRPEINSSSSSNAVGIEYAGNDKFMVVYGEGNKIFAQVVTNSSNNNYMELSAGTRTEIEDVGAAASYKLTVSPPDSNGRMLMFYRKALGGDFGLKYAILTISGTNVSYDGRSWVSSTNPVVLQTPLSAISYDPNEDRYLLTYERTSDNRLYGRNIKITAADAVSMSAETQLSTQNPYEGQGTVYDTNLKKHFVYFTDASTNKLSYVPVTFTGSSAPTAGTLGVIYNTAHRMRSFTIDYDATLGKVLTGARNEDSGPNFLAGLINQTASSTSNLGEDNFLGFSKGSYTDGNTAKIGTLSAVDENQTGLTTTTHYYVQPDGTLSTTAATPRVTAGKAVSSTNLIVKSDNDPRPGSLGHWTYSLSGGVFKPWCACGYGSNSGGIIGAYECANSSCRYCTGCWNPYCCVQSDHVWNYDLPTESGGNMCLGCGGCDCDSGYNITRACCCCWPTGRFWFPEVGIYCYNFNMILSSCMGAPPSGGCWSALSYYAVPKNRNRTCCNIFCGINGYHAYTTAACGFCEPRQAFDNVHIDGIVGVADTTKNFMAFGISKASMTNCVIVQNGVTLRGDGCTGRYPNYVSFQKISNDPRITYCN